MPSPILSPERRARIKIEHVLCRREEGCDVAALLAESDALAAALKELLDETHDQCRDVIGYDMEPMDEECPVAKNAQALLAAREGEGT